MALNPSNSSNLEQLALKELMASGTRALKAGVCRPRGLGTRPLLWLC